MRLLKFILLFCVASLLFAPLRINAQSEEAQQLLLNVEKLAQLKKILTQLYKGYDILSNGYNSIKDLSEGNFNLHKTFLDGLLTVNPAIAKYRRIADITRYQISLVREYKSAYKSFKESGNFTEQELDYISIVYSNLFSKSLQNLDGLTMVITSSKLRMSDDERLTAIEKIFVEVEDQLSFLRSFNNQAKQLGLQRKTGQQDVNNVRKLYQLK